MYGPAVTIAADTKKRSERTLTGREQSDRDAARAAYQVRLDSRDVAKTQRRVDLAALPNATLEQLRAILARVLV